ncbi:DUF4190 domain-containing protein [Haloglycomyces albus]|uniref:DUF4190 domain-containing protein n=1 Tax=Haloglycomyces albus TaxID=526067 RepID=UPI00046D1B83|nr:DUF4190 domain-containing protein [Haloglycomyces albus]
MYDNQSPDQPGAPMATAGIVLGWISTIGFLLLVILYCTIGVALFSGLSDEWDTDMQNQIQWA